MKWIFKLFGYFLGIIFLLLLLVFIYARWGLAPSVPRVANTAALRLQREKIHENFYRIGNNWLRQNKAGLWEEYVEGEPFERGVITGKLEKELLYSQEVAFVEQIHHFVPNQGYLGFLGIFTRLFNRHLEQYIPEENKLEIYGESFSAPKEFDYISPPYDRMLNYHAAHDIGHALQSLALVGCSSFAAWDHRSADSGLIIGRNLDFYMGEKFSKDKIVYFCKPAQGYKFVIITWAGFMGCVSGMNDKGITVTINAAKSDVPTEAKTPISILAREILQYSGNINDAFAIAKKRKTFVCETIMIGSAADHKTALIEKSVNKTALLEPDTNFIICTNHYQSDSFREDKDNIENMATSSSFYRYLRLKELLDRNDSLNYIGAASILRDRKGLHDQNIGTGNEKALNQLIAHHAIIFQPEKLRFWVSANPYQLGEFFCYDLTKVFSLAPELNDDREIHEAELTIPADTFLFSEDWKGYLKFRDLKNKIQEAVKNKTNLSAESQTTEEIIKANPEYWESYYWPGEYFVSRSQKDIALKYFNAALSKEINDTREIDVIKEEIKRMSAN